MQKLTKRILPIICLFAIQMSVSSYAQTPTNNQGTSSLEKQKKNSLSLEEEFKTIRADEQPESLTRDNTYYASNENELYLFYDVLKNRKGGIHIGVGTDPNYLFAGWAHPDIMILFDFDQNIADIHKVYGILFHIAKDRKDFLSLWKKDSRKRVYQAINDYTTNNNLRYRLKFNWRAGRYLIDHRIKRLTNKFNKLNIPTFLTNDDQYKYVADLWNNGKVYSIRGDLTKNHTMMDIAKVSEQLGIPISTAYFSNAEYYFTYGAGHYAKNVNALPFNDDSLVLNTIARSPKEYNYIYTPGNIYKEWVSDGRIKNLFRLQKYVSQPVSGKENLYTVRVAPSSTAKNVKKRIPGTEAEVASN